MIRLSEFRSEDLNLIKWPLVLLLLSVVLLIGLFLGMAELDARATNELNNARNNLNAAQDAVDKIEQEEATIIEYNGRYRELEAAGVVNDEDRLQFLERLAGLRATHSLFPIQINIDGQARLPLQYAPAVVNPGRPLALRASTVTLTLPLLHEDDLARLLEGVMNGTRLLQPQSCLLRVSGATNTSYIYLAQHFTAECSLLWYTFELPPEPAEVQP